MASEPEASREVGKRRSGVVVGLLVGLWTWMGMGFEGGLEGKRSVKPGSGSEDWRREVHHHIPCISNEVMMISFASSFAASPSA